MTVYRFLLVFLTILLIVAGVLLSEEHDTAAAGAMIGGGLGLVAIALSLRVNRE